MNLALPVGLLAAGLTVPLVLWYVLRSRRPKVTVASTFLWENVDRSVAAAIPWQRFRPDVTFWLVLLALLAGALALAQPFIRVPTTLGDHTVLIIDASGSMTADENGPSRLELARREAVEMVDRLAPGQRVSIVEAGTRARVLLSLSSDPAAARSSLNALAADHGQADLVDAFTLASALAQPGEQNVSILFTDTEVPPAAIKSAPRGLQVVPVGTPLPNLGITGLQAIPDGGGSSQVFVQAKNFGQVEVDAELRLQVDGIEVVRQRFRLPPRGIVDRVLVVQGRPLDILTATLAPVGDDLVTGENSVDRLSIDDTAWTLLSGTRELKVALATPGNVFLEAALASVAGVELEVTDTVPTDLDDIDLLVVDRLPSPTTLTVPALLVAPTLFPDGITSGADVEQPSLTFQTAGDPLLAEVDLSTTAIANGTPLAAPTMGPIAGGPSGNLVIAGRLDGVAVVALGFDLLQSNLPLQPAWPVLVNNIITGLTGSSSTIPVIVGQIATVPIPPGTTAAIIDPPRAAPRSLDLASPRLAVEQVGLWVTQFEGVNAGRGVPAIAVNADPVESDLVAGRPEAGPLSRADDAAAPATSEGRRSIVRWLLMAVLFLVVAEWLWAHVIRPARARGTGGGRRGLRRGPRHPTGPGSGPADSQPGQPGQPGTSPPDPDVAPTGQREEVGVG